MGGGARDGEENEIIFLLLCWKNSCSARLHGKDRYGKPLFPWQPHFGHNESRGHKSLPIEWRTVCLEAHLSMGAALLKQRLYGLWFFCIKIVPLVYLFFLPLIRKKVGEHTPFVVCPRETESGDRVDLDHGLCPAWTCGLPEGSK